MPWSSVVMASDAAPLKSAVGVKVIPFSRLLMFARVPVKVMVASAVPSPTRNVSPAVDASVIVPLVPVSVTFIAAPPASTSLIVIRFPLAVSKVRTESSLTDCAPGTVLTGGSLTALTVMLTVSVSLLAPPVPVLPWSLVTICTLAAPL